MAKPNRVKELRENQMLTRTEFARKSGASVLTIKRIEEGSDSYHLPTARKILLGLGLGLSDYRWVFHPEEMEGLDPVEEISDNLPLKLKGDV